MQTAHRQETKTTTSRSVTSGKWEPLFGVLVGGGLILLGCGRGLGAEPARPPAVHSIEIVLQQEASPAERRVAEILKARILNLTPVAIEVGTARNPGVDLYIHLGRLSGALGDLCARNQVRLPGKEKPNPEGFAVKTV